MNKGILRFLILFALAQLAFTYASAQEICDNGIDDDSDGLVDLNDPDCTCNGFTDFVTSTIPNPSFEQKMDCPDSFHQMDLAVDWQQASDATTDYIHQCGFMTGGYIDPPLPFPNGEACVGLASYISTAEDHDYVGTCLPDNLERDTSYTLKFHVGFGTTINNTFGYDSVYSSSPIQFTLYGAPNCSQLPFPGTKCPTDRSGSIWEPIDTIEVTGNNEWVETEFKFKPTQDIGAIILGAPCGSKNLGNEVQYHFIDNLILSKTSNFRVGEPTVSGSICDSTLALSSPEVGAGYNYQWYKDGIAISGANRLSLTLGGGDIEGEYQVRISKGAECEISLARTVNSSAGEQLNISGPRGICPNSDVTLQAEAGFTSYSWSNGDTTANITVSGGGNYSVTVTDQNGCPLSATFFLRGPIMINSGATVTDARVTNDNGSISLNPSGGIEPYQYNWSTGSDQSEIRNLSEGRYYVTITDDIGCIHIDSFDIEFVPNEFEFKFEVKNLDCYNDSSGRLKVEMTGGYPPFSILWNTGSTQDEIANLPAGRYSVTITDNLGEAKVYETYLSQPDPLSIDQMSLQEPLCSGDSNGSIDVAIQGGTKPYSYIWNEGALTGNKIMNIPAGAYALDVTDDNGCEFTDVISLKEPDPLEVDIYYEAPSCYGLTDGFIDIENIRGGTPPYTVRLNGEAIQLNGLDQLDAGNYDLEISDENQCMITSEIILELPPEVSVSAVADKEKIMQGETVTLSAVIRPSSLDNYSVLWTASTFDPQIDCPNCPETSSRPEITTVYTLSLDRNGCTYTDEILVDVSSTSFYAPNAFSPNGDGINDHFQFASNFEEGLIIKEVLIFDRWGSLVHTERNIDLDSYDGWDGRRDGVLMKTGVYVYNVVLENGRGEQFRFAGDVLLK